MNHLNSATQQNASASEELSATAEELSGQAAALQDMMAFFKLEAQGSSNGRRAAASFGKPSKPAAMNFSRKSGNDVARSMPASTPEPAHAVDEALFGRF
jgi:methyl-accepting chemotaxis protein